MRTLTYVAMSAAAVIATCASPALKAESAPVLVVYHVSEGTEQGYRALNNIANELTAEPSTRIVVVAYGEGLKFLKRGATTSEGGAAFIDAIKPLQARGVSFRVCRNSMNAQQLDAGDMVEGVVIVPSGVAEIAALQSRLHYAYIRP